MKHNKKLKTSNFSNHHCMLSDVFNLVVKEGKALKQNVTLRL